MRYIGGKSKMLPEIDKLVSKHLIGNEKIFVDLFAGSNVVGNYFKDRYEIITNDLMYFSYVISRGKIQLNTDLKFKMLKKEGIDDPFDYLNGLTGDSLVRGFITNNYTPYGKDKRMYFTEENGKKIDTVRLKIEEWHEKNLIDDDEYFYLLTSLIEAVPSISNTTGTYGAYLKHWDKRSLDEFEIIGADITINSFRNKSYNMDSIELASKLNGDIVYIDTPYNSRQYAPNYHILETIAKYDNPDIHGVTGQRDYSDKKSKFSQKREAENVMRELLKELNFKHAVLSYSTDGIISEKTLEGIISNFSKDGYFDKVKVPYRKYKSKINNDKKVYELLYYFNPIKFKPIGNNIENSSNKNESKIWSPKDKLIKSPLNYIGGKFKLLPQILPFFPEKINTFVDLFSGGANVGINVEANKHVFNDINYKVNDLFKEFQRMDIQKILEEVNFYINKYDLSKYNKEGFLNLRDDYNNSPNPIMLYTLVSFSFNYQFRFNSNMKYNNPFGKDRSYFSENMKSNLIRFVEKLHSIDAHFYSKSFDELEITNELSSDDFVYADPPYLITTGSYNDGKRGFLGWTDKEEKKLYKYLDYLNSKGIKFALSNVLEHKGRKNDILFNWSEKYNVHILDKDYNNSSYNTKKGDSLEVLITNY